MSLNDKTPPWGLDIEKRLNTKGKGATASDAYTDTDTHTDTHTDTDKHIYTDEYTHTDTDKYTANSKFVEARETKSKRLYLLVKPSVHQKISEYADATGDSTNNIINTLMEEFVAKHGL